jgi:hypothetical protein
VKSKKYGTHELKENPLNTLRCRKPFSPLIPSLFLFVILFGFKARADELGSIRGKILSTGLDVLADASVHISGMDQSFEKTVISDPKGVFEIIGLPAGFYTLRFEKPDYKTSDLVDVSVLPSQALYIRVYLNKNGDKDRSSTEVIRTDFNQCLQQTVLDRFHIHSFPSAHNLWSLVENQDLSATTNRIDVGGLWSNIPAVLSARGGGSWTQTTYLLNGFDVTDPYWTGLPLFFPDYYALRYTQLINAALPPYALSPGGYVNLITEEERSSTHGGVSAFYIQRSLQSSNITPNLEEEGISEANTFDYFLDGNVHITGPLIKDKLSFFASVTANDLSRDMADFDAMDKSSLLSGLASLRYDFSQSFLKVLWTGQRVSYASFGADRGVPFSVTTDRRDTFDIFQALWTGWIQNNHVLRAGLQYSSGNIRSDFQDDITGSHGEEKFRKTSTGAAPLAYNDTRKSFSILLRGDSFLGDLFPGNHSLQYGLQLQKSQSSSSKSIYENLHLFFYDGNPLEVVKYNTPVNHEESSLQINFYVQDSVTFSSLLSVYFGLNFDYSRGWVPGNGEDPSRLDIPIEDNRIQWFNISPRIGFIIPLSASKQSVLKLSFSRYYFRLPLNYLTYGNQGAFGGLAYVWNDWNNDSQFQENETGKILRREGPLYARIDADLKRPYTDEYAIVFTSAFGSDWHFSLGGFYRGTRDLIKTLNIGVPFSAYDPKYILDLGDDDIRFTEDDQIFTVYDQKNETLGQDFFLLTNHAEDPRISHYFGVDLNLIKRFRTNFAFFLSMTATQAEGTTNPGNTEWENDDGLIGTLYDDPNTLINAKGRVRFDRAYTIRLGLNYLAPLGINCGCVIKYYDGQPFSRKIIVEDLNQGPFYIQAHSRGAVRYEFNLTIDLRVEKAFRIGTSRLRFMIDGFNMLNSGLATAENPWTGPEFKLRYATEIQSPRVFRLGLAYEF